MNRSVLKRASLVVALALSFVSTAPPASAVITTVGTTAVTTGDFDGNGVSDLAVGVPGEAVGFVVNAGAVNVIYGKATGLAAQADQIWTQNSSGITDIAQDGDNFGYSVAAGDFDGDGFDDLAVGVPRENTANEADPGHDSGAVNVLYGSPSGLTAVGSQYWLQTSMDAVETDDLFGRSLAVGNFGKSGQDDLAIGSPGEAIGATTSAGAAGIVYGSAGGLQAAGSKFLSQDVTGVPGGSEAGDLFGWSLAAGNLGKSNHADLASGIINETVDLAETGAVNVFYGSANGVATSGSQLWHPGVPDIKGGEDSVTFGWSLAAGDFGKGSKKDLAIGAPTSEPGGAELAGAIHVIYGSSSGLRSQGNQMWHEGSPGVLNDPASFEVFGSTLASGDFGKSDRHDLAVSAPRSEGAEGLVHVFYGGANGLSAAGDQLWRQNSPGVNDQSEGNDFFGNSLAAGNLGKGGRADLAIGVGPESVGSISNAGAVNVLYGSAQGVRAEGDQFWHQDVNGIEDEAENLDRFGGFI
jgi:hypothetical protein